MEKSTVAFAVFTRFAPSRCRYTKRIQDLIEAIQANLKGAWSVAEMAAFCNLSTTYFRSMFKDAIGMAPKMYVDQLRMEKARESRRASPSPLPALTRNPSSTLNGT